MARSRRGTIVLTVLALLVASGYAFSSKRVIAGSRLFDQVLTLVSRRYVQGTGNDSLYEDAARGLIRQLGDPYAALYTPQELSEFTRQTDGHYEGVGMLVEDQRGAAVVTQVYPRTSAEEHGVREGDVITSIDGRSATGWTLKQVTSALRGAPGSSVHLVFTRPDASEQIAAQLERRVVHIPAVPFSAMLDGDVGYVPLRQFSQTSAEETRAAIQRLVASGAHGLVLDLRHNGGGEVAEALAITNLFLHRGQEIASVRGRQREPEVYIARDSGVVPGTPLIVLTDGYSASATEIVAGALQDHDRALIVGGTTFGKGLVQSVFRLDGGYALKLTTGKWTTPSGRSIHRPRKVVDGELVDDSVVELPDSALAARPVFRSDAGRMVYGGGGITPDVAVHTDTLSDGEQRLVKILVPKLQDVHLVLYRYAFELRHGVQPEFTVPASWRDELYRRLTTAGVAVDRPVWNGATSFVDRLLGDQVAHFAFGDSSVARRNVHDDAPLDRAIALLHHARTQNELLAQAQRSTPAG